MRVFSTLPPAPCQSAGVLRCEWPGRWAGSGPWVENLLPDRPADVDPVQLPEELALSLWLTVWVPALPAGVCGWVPVGFRRRPGGGCPLSPSHPLSCPFIIVGSVHSHGAAGVGGCGGSRISAKPVPQLRGGQAAAAPCPAPPTPVPTAAPRCFPPGFSLPPPPPPLQAPARWAAS